MITADGRTVVFHILPEELGDSDADASPLEWLGDLDFDGIDGGCLDATAMLSSEREEASDDHDLQPAESEEVEGGHVEAAPLAMVAIVDDDASDEQEPEPAETEDGGVDATAALVEAEFEVPYNGDGEGEEEEPEVDLPAKLELDSD